MKTYSRRISNIIFTFKSKPINGTKKDQGFGFFWIEENNFAGILLYNICSAPKELVLGTRAFNTFEEACVYFSYIGKFKND